MAVHLRFKSLYMSLPCSTRQQRVVTTEANFLGIFTLSLFKLSNVCASRRPARSGKGRCT